MSNITPSTINSPLFCEDILSVIAPHLSDKDLVAAARVCKFWNKAFQPRCCLIELEKEYARRLKFDPRFIEALRRSNVSLMRLPELDVRAIGRTDYIYLKQSDISSPLMRFIDLLGRPGLAMKIKGRDVEGHFVNRRREVVPIREFSTTAVIFLRYKNCLKPWVFGTISDEQNSDISAQHWLNPTHEYHDGDSQNSCFDCPSITGKRTDIDLWAEQILANTHPLLTLNGLPEQIEIGPFVLPKPIEEREDVEVFVEGFNACPPAQPTQLQQHNDFITAAFRLLILFIAGLIFNQQQTVP